MSIGILMTLADKLVLVVLLEAVVIAIVYTIQHKYPIAVYWLGVAVVNLGVLLMSLSK
jgi:hypothetical protein